MPNPFDRGNALQNLTQIFGDFGFDWFIPVRPLQPVADGVSYPRIDQATEQELELPTIPILGASGGEIGPDDVDFKVQELWKLRYRVRPRPAEASVMEPREDKLVGGPLDLITSWWSKTSSRASSRESSRPHPSPRETMPLTQAAVSECSPSLACRGDSGRQIGPGPNVG